MALAFEPRHVRDGLARRLFKFSWPDRWSNDRGLLRSAETQTRSRRAIQARRRIRILGRFQLARGGGAGGWNFRRADWSCGSCFARVVSVRVVRRLWRVIRDLSAHHAAPARLVLILPT